MIARPDSAARADDGHIAAKNEREWGPAAWRWLRGVLTQGTKPAKAGLKPAATKAKPKKKTVVKKKAPARKKTAKKKAIKKAATKK